MATDNISPYFVTFNMGWLPFMDADFRKDISYTIDYEKIITTVLLGRGAKCAGLIAPSNSFWHDPDVDAMQPDYNLNKAKQILRDAGYEWDEEGNLCYPATYNGDPYTPLP